MTARARALVCVERPSEVEAARRAAAAREDATLVALTPHAAHAVEGAGLAHRQPEDYYADDDLHELGSRELARVNSVCEAIDVWIGEAWPACREVGLTPGAATWYTLKILLNSVVVHLFIADRIIARENPAEVVGFATAPETPGDDLAFVRESIWSHVLSLVCEARGVRCTLLPAVSVVGPTQIAGGVRGAMLRGARHSASVVRRAYRSARLGVATLADGRPGRVAPVPTLVFLSRDYNLGPVAEEARRRGGPRIVHWDIVAEAIAPDAQLTAEAERLWAGRPREALSALFEHAAIDLMRVVEPRLRHLIVRVFPDLVAVARRAVKLLASVSPAAVVAATMGDPRTHAVAHAARHLGISVVVYKHGSSGGYVLMESGQGARDFAEITLRNDILPADLYLVNGEGDRAFYERHCQGAARIVAVGSSRLDDLRRRHPDRDRARRRLGLDPKRLVVVYAPTSMDANVRPVPYRNRSPARMVELERALLSVFLEFPSIDVVVKLPRTRRHPLSPIADLVEAARVEHVRVRTEPFVDFLPVADLFVFDYVSTTFLEALTTDRPILFCGDGLPWKWAPGVWHPTVLPMWKERVEYAEDRGSFTTLLRRTLAERRFAPVGSDTLLRLFGTHLDDGRSAQRALEEVMSLRRDAPAGASVLVGPPANGGGPR